MHQVLKDNSPGLLIGGQFEAAAGTWSDAKKATLFIVALRCNSSDIRYKFQSHNNNLMWI